MAITTPTLVNALTHSHTGPFAVNNDEGDGDPAVEMVAAPGENKAIHITHVTLSDRTVDCAVTLQDEDGTVLFGPIQLQADGSGLFSKDFKFPLKLTDNKALDVFGTNGVAFTAYVEYFIGQKI